MNTYSIMIKSSEINFSPTTVLEEIFQNVNTIVSTSIYTVPLFREFGVKSTYLDEPTPISKARFINEVVEKVERFEPRVIVEEVNFTEDEIMDGRLIPIVKIKIRNGVSL